MKKIIAELSRIQQGLKAPKNLFNKFGNYHYRNAEGILEAVKPLLGETALILNDEPVVIGNRFYIKATATLTDGDESISSVAYAREDETKKGMDGCQLTGACSSYARKYALNALLMIDDSKDSDDDELTPKNPKNKEEPEKPKKSSEPIKPPTPSVEVTTGGTAPQPESVPLTEAQKYLSQMQKQMKEEFGDNFNFAGVRSGLIQLGVVPDIKSSDLNMEQAAELVDAIYQSMRRAG